MSSAEISIEGINATAKRLVENFHLHLKHTPKLLRESMSMAYCQAIDDMLKALDHNKITESVKMDLAPKPVLLDDKGYVAT